MSTPEAELEESSAPMWAAFGDLMACMFGLFVLFFAWVVTFDVALERDLLDAQHKETQATERLAQLQRAIAGPIARGTVTLVEGRIGIRGSVLFERNSAALSEEGRALLEELAAPLAAYLTQQEQALMVSGFTDDLKLHGASRAYLDNWELSSQRALTVVRALIVAGLPAEHLFAAGFGENHPIAPNDDEEARTQNRRVELSPVPRPRRVAPAHGA